MCETTKTIIIWYLLVQAKVGHLIQIPGDSWKPATHKQEKYEHSSNPWPAKLYKETETEQQNSKLREEEWIIGEGKRDKWEYMGRRKFFTTIISKQN